MFCNIYGDELEHVKTMVACQDGTLALDLQVGGAGLWLSVEGPLLVKWDPLLRKEEGWPPRTAPWPCTCLFHWALRGRRYPRPPPLQPLLQLRLPLLQQRLKQSDPLPTHTHSTQNTRGMAEVVTEQNIAIMAPWEEDEEASEEAAKQLPPDGDGR